MGRGRRTWAAIDADRRKLDELIEVACKNAGVPVESVMAAGRRFHPHPFYHLRQEIWLVAADKGMTINSIAQRFGNNEKSIREGIESALKRYEEGKAMLVDVLGEAV